MGRVLQPDEKEKHRGMELPAVLIIALISFTIPIVAHLLMKNGDSETEPENNIVAMVDTSNSEQEPVQIIEVDQVLAAIGMLTQIITKDINIREAEIEQSKTLSISDEPHLQIQWLESPVMQAWEYNDRRRAWETVLPFRDSMRSQPTLVIGLREDGVVVWKRLER